MGVPLFKGEQAFDLFDQKIDGMVAVAERQVSGHDDALYGAAKYIGSGDHRYCLQDAEPALLGDIRNRVRALMDEGLTREKLYETFVEALPGLTLPGQDPKRVQRVPQAIHRHFKSVISGENETTLDESERDAIRTIFKGTAEYKQPQYDVDPAVIEWLGDVYTKLDRAFSETWHTAWTMAQGNMDGAPAKDDVTGLESRFVAPGANGPGG